jgi:hypothetical protein
MPLSHFRKIELEDCNILASEKNPFYDLIPLLEKSSPSVRRNFMKALAVQFAPCYWKFCSKNNQIKREVVHREVIACIMSDVMISANLAAEAVEILVFDDNVEFNLVETEGSFSAAVFAAYTVLDEDRSIEAANKFSTIMTGVNAYMVAAEGQLDTDFDYEKFPMLEVISGFALPHVAFIGGEISKEAYFDQLRHSNLLEVLSDIVAGGTTGPQPPSYKG